MNKIVFSNNTEIEISSVTQSGNTLSVSIDTQDVNSVIAKFSDKESTSVMRYYSGVDLIRGYSGFTNLQNVVFTPNVTADIDYEIEDETTSSGFAETFVDRCVVTMKKVSALAAVEIQTAQNTANIDYIAMETGVEL